MVIRRGWADSIAVKSDGDSLILTGVRLSRPEVDLFDQGYAKVKNDKDSRPLYLWLSEVSNADEVAVAAACYGAFYGELMEHSFPPSPHKEPSVISQELSRLPPGGEAENLPFTRLVVKQSDSVALREISALRALLSLLEASRGDEITRDSLSEDERRQEYEAIAGQLADLANQTGTWQRQLAKEKAARKRHKVAPDPGWSWSDIAQERLEAAKLRFSFLSTCPDDQLRWAEALVIMPRSTLRFVVTTILNAFPPLLEWDSIGMIQHSGTDLIFGIRPLIYSMIREDLLAQVEIRLCRNKSCGRFFRADRRDQTCCKAACSERVRYLKYYETKRKPARLASRKLPG